MEAEKVVKSTQEQAVASWVNYLNQIRMDRLIDSLNKQHNNLVDALEDIDKAFSDVTHIIETNRGGTKGIHGFIAEAAEVGIGNARQNILGNPDSYSWINDNGPTDLVRDGINIQQKFHQSGLSLNAIEKHHEKYPDYLQNGGKYQIPEEQYNQIKYLLSLSKEQADKMPTSDGTFSLRKWRTVHDFFEQDDIDFERDMEGSVLEYKDVQVGKIGDTLDIERESLLEKDQELRNLAYQESQPTVNEGLKVTAVSAAVEGCAEMCLAITRKIKSGKNLTEFDEKDWVEIAKETGLGTVKGGFRGASIYALTNRTATPAAVASSLVTASLGVAEQAHLYRIGELTQLDLIDNAEILCMDAAVSALSSFLGQAVIPVPVLGAVIGNAVGTMMYKIAQDNLSESEQKIMRSYLESVEMTKNSLEQKYRHCLDIISKDMAIYIDILNQIYSPNLIEAFHGSIKMANYMGVPSEEILDVKEKVDAFFLD